MSDELAEINGIKPNVVLADGEQREVGSATSKSVYKVKRTSDHYFCSCPAWRNQSGMPVNARTCKHLKSFLGEAYELARIELKNPGGAAAAPAKKAAASKAKAPAAKKEKAPAKPRKAPAKKKKVEEEEDEEGEEGEEEEEEEEEKPKRAAPKRGAAAKAPAAKGKGKANAKVKKEEDEDEDEDAMDVDVKPAGGAANPNDELAEINGIEPNVVLIEGQEHEVKSATSKSVYKVKRTFDHYYCTCPAWRNQKGAEVNARTCKHLQSFLGEEYEAARIALRTGAPPASKAKPASKAAAAKKPASKAAAASKPASKAKAPAKRGAAAKVKKEEEDLEEEDEEEDGEEQEDVKPKAAVAANPDDELTEINGIKPKVYLVEGEEHEVKSATSKSVYKVKRTFDHYYCTCPAWRNQKGVETNSRTCKHLQAFLGEEYEAARLALRSGGAAPASKAKPVSKVKPASKAAAAKKPASTAKKPASTAKKPASKSAGSKRKKVDEDEDEEADEEEPEKRAKVEETIKEEDEDGDEEMDDDTEKAPVDGDELAEIDGHKPKVYMKDGDETEVKSATSSSMYKVKRTWDHYYCTCPAWRNQGGAPTNARTCKHLQGLLGAEYEAARLLWKNPNGPIPKAPKSKGKGKGKAKKADGEEGEDAEEGEEGGGGIPGLLLAQKWDIEDGPDPKGWWLSEKLDGVRTYYDGEGGFFSRLGNPFTPPQWFVDALPKGITLDGELFAGRGQFQSAVSIVKTVNSPHWKGISFQVFDVPSKGDEPFETRVEYLKELFGENGTHVSEHVKVVEHLCVRDREHVIERLKEVEDLGGEGVMLRRPQSQYEGTRSSSLLKVKTFFDAEAIVEGYAPGKGKHAGSTGALKCKMASGKTFNVGSGLSDKQRKNPPKVGSIIVYRFQELTRDGVPRFPTFVGEAADKTEPKDADIPEARKGGAAKE